MCDDLPKQECFTQSPMANRYPQVRLEDDRYPQFRSVVESPGTICDDREMGARFLTLADVAETLNISASQAYALVRSGDLPAIKVGGRGQWRIEVSVLEEYIKRMYEQARTPSDPNATQHKVTEVNELTEVDERS
jgi:excisionase family DNA binding protein